MMSCKTLEKGKCCPILIKGIIMCNIGGFECQYLKLG